MEYQSLGVIVLCVTLLKTLTYSYKDVHMKQNSSIVILSLLMEWRAEIISLQVITMLQIGST